jgi:hypothetical protein
VAHFLIPMALACDDVVRTCAHSASSAAEQCVTDWLRSTDNERGYVMDLATLWRLARGWYAGRLERGYQRRERIVAYSYFAEVGLSGRFCGLP